MVTLEEVTAGAQMRGLAGSTIVEIVRSEWIGSDALNVVYRAADGPGEVLLYRDAEPRLELVQVSRAFSFDGDGETFRIASEAQRIRLAHLFDPYLAVHSSRITPLPHQYLPLADAQALTDNAHNPGRVRDNVLEIATDYLGVGIDPNVTTICLQSHLPALADLTLLYLNFVTVARLERNPTIKDEIQARGFGRDVPAGFLCYPVAQAADITGFKATIVPVGEDQAPLIEQTNEVVRRINRQAGVEVLPEARALIPRVGRLPGIDGKAEMRETTDATLRDVRAALGLFVLD